MFLQIKNNLIFWGILAGGILLHIYFLHLNEILKVADSFAYLQMSHFLKEFSVEGLGSGWFGFLYSLPIALVDSVLGNDFLAAKIVNMGLLGVSGYLVYRVGENILTGNWKYLPLILFLLSPTYMHFSIHVLSENIYIPLFLLLFLQVEKFLKNTYQIESPGMRKSSQVKTTISLGCIIGLLYLTRAEAFIYILSIGILSTALLVLRKISIGNFTKLAAVFFVSFFFIVSPYLYHLHTLTGEWGLTNKGASNLRQAELRGIEKMDDSGFEQAVAELTDDNKNIIAGFAGGMQYQKPQIEGSLVSFISQDPTGFLQRVLQNQQKLFTKNIPEIFLGKSPQLFFSDDSRFGGNILFVIFSLFPLIVLVYGIYSLYRKEKIFFYISLSFFIPAFIFFTLFFTLNRYFLIFLPLLIIAVSYGIQSVQQQKYSTGNSLVSGILIGNIVCVFLLSNLVYFNTEKTKDSYYELKKQAGIWMQENNISDENTNILERFPIVTYYSGSKNRWITPYETDIKNISSYAQHNNIDYLVVDTMDFLTYRPFLADFLSHAPEGLENIKSFQNDKGQKVILYRFKK